MTIWLDSIIKILGLTLLAWKGVCTFCYRFNFLMAKEEYITQCNIARDTSKLRNRKTCPTSEKIQTFPIPSKNTQHSSEDDSQSSNGTSAHRSNRGRDSTSDESPSRGLLLLLLVAGLSFSTRLYKITEPPHVWWVKVFCIHVCVVSVHLTAPFVTQRLLLVFQLGWDALWEDGKLLHQQDLLFWCPSSSWKSKITSDYFLYRLNCLI